MERQPLRLHIYNTVTYWEVKKLSVTWDGRKCHTCHVFWQLATGENTTTQAKQTENTFWQLAAELPLTIVATKNPKLSPKNIGQNGLTKWSDIFSTLLKIILVNMVLIN